MEGGPSTRLLSVVGESHACAETLRSLADETDGVAVVTAATPERVEEVLTNGGVDAIVGVDGTFEEGSVADLLDDAPVPTAVVDGDRSAVVRSVAEGFVERTQRDRIYESVVDAAPTPMLLHDSDATILYANDRVADLVGFDDGDDLVGERSVSFLSDGDRPEAAERMARVFEERESADEPAEYRVVAPTENAEDRHVLAGAIPVTYRGVEAGLVVLSDVTEHRRRQHTLQQERDRFVTLFENLPNPVVYGHAEDTTPVVRKVNAAFEAMFGYDSETVEGESLHEFIAPEDADAETVSERLLREGRVTTEVRRETADGPRDFQLNVVVSDGDPPEGYAIYTDVTERKEREQRLQRQNERLEEFASILSHDLRNPVNVAEGYAELLAADYDDERIAKLEDALGRMDALIGKVLAMARQGQVVDEPEPVALDMLAERCWYNVATEEASLVVDDSSEVVADAGRLSQLLANLFRNSVEHGSTSSRAMPDDIAEGTSASNRTFEQSDDNVEHGSETVTVTVGTLDDDSGFYVADDGPGIPEREREAVFESGYSTREEGTGLGLNIVEQIAHAHGWTVSVTEGADGGARFEFRGVNVR